MILPKNWIKAIFDRCFSSRKLGESVATSGTGVADRLLQQLPSCPPQELCLQSHDIPYSSKLKKAFASSFKKQRLHVSQWQEQMFVIRNKNYIFGVVLQDFYTVHFLYSFPTHTYLHTSDNRVYCVPLLFALLPSHCRTVHIRETFLSCTIAVVALQRDEISSFVH